MSEQPSILLTQALERLDAGDPREALPLLQRAAALAPGDADLRFYLGLACEMLKLPERAIAEYQQALTLNPHHVESHGNLASVLRAQGRVDEALAHYRKALALRPLFTDALCNLGSLLLQLDQPQEAVGILAQAVHSQPQNATALCHLGSALQATGQWESAAQVLGTAVRIDPANVAAQNNLGSVLRELGRTDAATAAFEAAHRLAPGSVEILNNLGCVHMDAGDHAQAMACFRRGLQIDAEYAPTESNLLYAMLFDPAADEQAIRAELDRWGHRHAARGDAPPIRQSHSDRRLRIGYVSPDFYQHAESFFILPLWESHDRGRIVVHAYSSTSRADDTTRRLRQAVDHWHDVRGLSNQQLAAKIREDGIDILIDLTLHMANNRAALFALRPAPVQIAWLAYPGSGGNPGVDFRITDPFFDPPEALFSSSEQPLHLPETWACYHSLAEGDLPTPALPPAGSPITFASLNNPCKINDPLLALWARVLAAVPNSRMMLLATSSRQRQAIRGTFQEQAIDPARLEFLDRMPRHSYLQQFQSVHVCLDTLPYNGITTSLDALWMGVPVVTLAGPRITGRAGMSILSNLGHREWIARTPEDFVRIAAELAQDSPAIARLRSSLRGELAKSPLMDGPRFARHFEEALCRAWSVRGKA